MSARVRHSVRRAAAFAVRCLAALAIASATASASQMTLVTLDPGHFHAALFQKLADKPWIIEPEDLSRLQAALDAAAAKGVVAYDAMTQRFEISALLQRALVNDADIFGSLITGSLDDPAVYLESLHYLLKEVAGVPSLRPVWFFDIREQGEGLTDVGTHLADMAPWILFPDQAIAYQREIQVLRGTRWPTLLALEQFQRVTGERDFPESLQPAVKDGRLEYFANNTVHYTLRGVQVQLVVKYYVTTRGVGLARQDFKAPSLKTATKPNENTNR